MLRTRYRREFTSTSSSREIGSSRERRTRTSAISTYLLAAGVGPHGWRLLARGEVRLEWWRRMGRGDAAGDPTSLGREGVLDAVNEELEDRLPMIGRVAVVVLKEAGTGRASNRRMDLRGAHRELDRELRVRPVGVWLGRQLQVAWIKPMVGDGSPDHRREVAGEVGDVRAAPERPAVGNRVPPLQLVATTRTWSATRTTTSWWNSPARSPPWPRALAENGFDPRRVVWRLFSVSASSRRGRR